MYIHNFSAGPAALPKPVLLQAQKELMNWQGRGYSVMEVSHRSNQYMSMVQKCEDIITKLLDVPQNYRILFTTLSATAHFGLLPLNIAQSKDRALYLNTGHWSHKASQHAASCIQVTNMHVHPTDDPHQWAQLAAINPNDFTYAHFCPNETIDGITWPYRPPLPRDLPLVGDFSSCLFATKINVNDYAMIYAGAQKNIGPSGISLVIIREDLLGKAQTICPPACNYTKQAEQHSLLHTPNTFGIYLIYLVCQWLECQGGVNAFAIRNSQRAHQLYQVLDANTNYTNTIAHTWRSHINIPFQLVEKYKGKEQKFLQSAEKNGLLFLQGHRAVGGMRANLYNAVENQSVSALIDFLYKFS